MLYVEGGNHSNRYIDAGKTYFVWDSDDFTLEKHSGRAIIYAYLKGIKFANIARNKDMRVQILYVRYKACDSTQYYNNGVIETDNFYFCYFRDKLFLHDICMLYWYGGKLYTSSTFKGENGNFSIVPAVYNDGNEKNYCLFDIETGIRIKYGYVCDIDKLNLRKMLIMKGAEYLYKQGGS